MKNFKHHLVLIREYENQIKLFDLINDYLNDNNATLIKQICYGEILLPSFILLKNLYNKYKLLCKEDLEVRQIFLNLIECSKIVYINLITGNWLTNTKQYEIDFEKEIQPVGQKIVDLLIHLKYRLRILNDCKKMKIQVEKRSKILVLYKNCINQFIYKITLLRVMHHKAMKQLYYSIIASLAAGFWLADFSMLNNISIAVYVFTNIIVGIALLIIAMISDPIGDFGKVDISGKNIVAYRYKTFMNNKKNKKITRVISAIMD